MAVNDRTNERTNTQSSTAFYGDGSDIDTVPVAGYTILDETEMVPHYYHRLLQAHLHSHSPLRT